MLGEVFTWGFIASLYIAAFAVLQLEKHWYKTAQALFLVATVFAIGRLAIWSYGNRDTATIGSAIVLTIIAIALAVWFVRKVEDDIPKAKEWHETPESELTGPMPLETPDATSAQQEQASAPVMPMYDRFLNHPASLGLPERTYSFYAGPEDAPSSRPIEVKARLRYDSTWSAAIVGIYVNAESEAHTGNGCVAAIRNYNQIAADLLKDARERNVFFDRTVGLLEIYNEVPLGDGTVNRIGRVNPSGLNIEFIGSVPFPRG